MDALSNSFFRHNNLSGLPDKNNQGGLNLQSGVLSRTRSKAEIEITTAEGDRVTLLSQSKIRAAYASYDSMGTLKGNESSGSTELYRIISANKVSISVEGHLSEEEIADIQNLLQSIEDLFMNFLTKGGNIGESQPSPPSLDTMKTLSNFDAELKYSQKVTGFGISSGNNSQMTGAADEKDSATADVTTVTAFKSRMKASMNLSGTWKVMEEPAPANINAIIEPVQVQPGSPEEPSAAVQTLTDKESVPTSADNTASQSQAADASQAGTDSLSSNTTVRMKLVEEFAALINDSTLDLNRLASVLSQLIPKMIDMFNANYKMSEFQKSVLLQTGDEVINTLKTAAPI